MKRLIDTREMTRREWLRASAVIAAASQLAPDRVIAEPTKTEGVSMKQDKTDSTPWYRRTLVGIEVGPTGANADDAIYMARATGKEIVENLRKARVEYAVLFMKDMEFAYYNSKAARKCPNLGDRDLLQECIDESRSFNLPIVAYCQIQYDTSTYRAHPEWRMKGSDGKDLDGRLCYTSGYLEFIKVVAAEMMEYAISGFHFDMLDFGFGPPYGCWCASCRAKFREKYGIDAPSGVTWDDAWDKMLQFRADSNTKFCEDLQAFVKERRPDISVDFNYHGYSPFTWMPGERPVQHARNGDFVTAEGLPWIFGYSNPSFLSLFMAGAKPEGPVQGVTSRSVYDYHDFSVRPTAEMKWEVMTYLAHGAQCTIVDKANYDGTLDPIVYERIGEVFGEAREKRGLFGHKPIAEVGLYYSSRSRDWYAREDTPKYFAAFKGAHWALTQAHIPVRFLMDESATLERLRECPVVYVPNAAIVSEKEAALFREYVSGGGNLLVTGLTGLCDVYGQLQEKSAIEDLIGARLVKAYVEHPDNYLRLPKTLAEGEGRFLLEGIPGDWLLLTWGPVAAYEATTATGFGEVQIAYRSKNNMWSAHMSPDKAVGPAVMVNRVGKGTVVCVPCAVDTAFIQRYRVPEHRNLIRNVIRYLNPNPPCTVQAPANVECAMARDEAGKRTLVHLLCFSALPTTNAMAFPEGRLMLPAVMEEPMTYQARIRINRPFTRAETASKAAVTVSGSEVTAMVSAPHEAIVIYD